MHRGVTCVLLACGLVAVPASIARAAAAAESTREPAAETRLDAAAELSLGIADAVLRELTDEALERNPHLQALAAQARAESYGADRVGGLPDPEVGVTAYIEPPETRVGPQRLMAAVMQRLPWSGKRGLSRDTARHRARAVQSDLEAARLKLVTDVRRVYHELAFVASHITITEEFRDHLVRHEEIARARYTSGRGGTQGALKLQAEITRVDQRLLDLEARRASLSARLNGLLDRPPGQAAPPAALAAVRRVEVDLDRMVAQALERNPQLDSATALIASAESEVGQAEKRFQPDFMVGLTYAWVAGREDPAGLTSPPPDNGQDVFGIQGGIRIPLWKSWRRAGLEESLQRKAAREQARIQVATSISAELADLVERIELTWRELRLLEDLLVVQAEEALESAQAGYVAGTLNALDLFDAEHLLFDTRTAVARATADYLVAVARLEGEIAGELEKKAES